MIWDKDIFLNNKKDLKEIGYIGNGVIYQLLYKNYRLFFIREYREKPYRNNVFWVNILSPGTIFEKYKNESIMTYRLGEQSTGQSLLVSGNSYIGVHTGNLFNNYCQLKGLDLSHPNSERYFWADVNKSLNGSVDRPSFIVSKFGKYMIIYGMERWY